MSFTVTTVTNVTTVSTVTNVTHVNTATTVTIVTSVTTVTSATAEAFRGHAPKDLRCRVRSQKAVRIGGNITNARVLLKQW